MRSGAGLQDEEVPAAAPTYDAALTPSRPGLSVPTEVSAAIPSPKPQQQPSTVHVECAPGSPAVQVTSSGGGAIDPAPVTYPSSSSGGHASGASGSSNQISGGCGSGSGGVGSGGAAGGGSEGGGYLAGLTARRYLDQYITPVLREALKELVRLRLISIDV